MHEKVPKIPRARRQSRFICNTQQNRQSNQINVERRLKLLINVSQTGSCGNEMTVGTFLTSSDYSLDVEALLVPTCGKYDWWWDRSSSKPRRPKTFATDWQLSLLELIMQLHTPSVKVFISKTKYGIFKWRCLKNPDKSQAKTPV